MCGLFGFAKRESWQSEAQLDKIEDVVSNLTWESVVRGNHSTGFAIASKSDKMVYKTLKASDELVCSKDWYKVLDKVDADTTIFMGHVRFATTGDITKKNAHPFVKGSVIGAHNGIIDNHRAIQSKIGKKVDVDSEVIFGLLNKKDKYQDVFDLLEGDFALTWINDDYRTLNLMHEDGRPLHVAYWKKARCLFWASTDEILRNSLKSAGLSIKINNVPTDVVYEYNTENFWTLPKPTKTPVKTNENYNRYSKYDYYGSSYWNGGNTNSARYNGSSSLKLTSGGEWVADCSDCGEEKRFDEVKDSYSGYVCTSCDTDTDKSSSFNKLTSMKQCDYCGDYQQPTDLKKYNHLDLCEYCVSMEKVYYTGGDGW
mgnify:CR=1 FL=1